MDDEVRWLDETEMTTWLAVVELVGRLPRLLERDLRETSDLGFEDYEVLVHLSAAPDQRLRMSELADSLIHSRSRLSRRIDRMSERGLVERRPCPEDGRAIHAALTPHGRDVLEAAAPHHLRSVRRHVFDQLDDEQVDVLARLLPGLADHLRAEDLGT